MNTAVPTIDPAKVPRQAMRWAFSDRMQFSEGDAETGILPFRMVARSLEPVDHYYWGRIVHDMAGMILRKDSVTVDYTHGFDEVIGFANQFGVTDQGLEVSGSLVTTQPNDKADEVYRKGKAGIPYEASIDWVGPEVELEYIPSDVTTEVNGKQFSGPGYVVRKWPLRAISICRYGVDPDTRTQFSKTEADTLSVSILNQKAGEANMAELTTTPAAAAAVNETVKPAGTETQQFAQGGHISIDQLKQFSAEFGPKGTEYLTQGLSIDAARYQFAVHERDAARAEVKQFGEQLTAKDATIADLQTKLKQFGVEQLGQDKPLDTTGSAPAAGGPEDPKFKQFSLIGGDARAKFACGMKLKGT